MPDGADGADGADSADGACGGNGTCGACAAAGDGVLGSRGFQAAVCLLYAGVFLASLAGNALVCCVVRRAPRMKTVTNYFIVNLAVGDMLMTVLCVPFSFVSTLLLRYWPFGALLCRAVNYSQAVSVLVSAYTLLAISLDRYGAIVRPLRPRLSRSAAKAVIAAVWAGALATAAPICVVSRLDRPTEWHVQCELEVCLEVWGAPGQSARYTWVLLGAQFVLPLTALVGTYARIARAVWAPAPGEAQPARDSRLQRNKRKMIKMMVSVVITFTVCWLPLNIFIVLYTVHEGDAAWAAWPGMPYVWLGAHWLAMAHCCCNPLIYGCMNARYRRGYRQVLSGLPCARGLVASHSCQRSSFGDGVPLSEVVRVNGGGCGGGCGGRLQRAPTSTTFVASRRAAPRPAPPAAPPRALSVRAHFS